MENLVDVLQEEEMQFWARRTVLVTGAGGFVASWLVQRLLQARCRVVALVHRPDPQSNLYRSGAVQDTLVVTGNLEDYLTVERTISKFEVDTVFHLGAQPIVGVAYRSPLATFEANIRGTYNLLEACRQHNDLVKRVVVASSDKAYGVQEVLPYDEDMPLKARHPYDVSKACADMLAHTYHSTYGLPVAVSRCGNIYGGGDLNWSRIVPDTIRCCLRGVPLEIRSDGQFVRDYLYVKDVARAYMRLAECMDDPRVVGQAFNFSPVQPVNVLEMVEKIQQLMGCTEWKPVIRNNAVGEIPSQYLDSSRARDLLGWQTRYSMEDALRETIAWYTSYLSSGAGAFV